MPSTIGYVKNGQIGRRLSKKMQKRLTHAVDRLSGGQVFRQNTREDAWRESYNQYMGKLGWGITNEDATADLVSVNISFSTINTLVPFVADEDPSFIIEPYSGDATAENAVFLQSFLNRLWSSSDVNGTLHIREGTFDYLQYGDGFVKLGYEIKEKPVYDTRGDTVPNNVEIAEFSVARLNPWDIWIDPYSDGFHNARWVCERIIMPADELKNDERYKVGREDISGGLDPNFQSPEDRERLDMMEDWVTIYEFYDLKERWMLAFVAGGGPVLRYVEHLECPIIQIPNYRIPNSPWHMGELEQIASLQAELNKTRSQMITHRRRNAMKWIVRKQALSDDSIEAMKSSIVNDVIVIEGNDPFETLIQQITPAPLARDAYALDDQIRMDINEVTGVNEYLRGVPQNISRTATEATIIEGATNIRTRHKLLQIETAATQAGQMLLDIIRDVLPLTSFEEMRQFITGREAEKLNRADGQEEINTDVIFTPSTEIFQGRYEVSVERGSTELRNPEVKAAKLKDMVVMMLSATQLLQQLGIPFNIKRLMEMWFEAEGIDDVQALFEIEDQQELMQQLAILQQAQAAQGQPGPSGAAGGNVVGGAATGLGQPRPQTALPPEALIDENNSGILAPTGA